MKIILEALRIPPFGGVRTAAIGWLKALAEYSPTTNLIALLSQPEVELQAFPNIKQVVVSTKGRFLPRLQLQILIPWLVKKHEADIVHFLRNLAVIVPNAQVVVNINDLNRLVLPEAYSKWDILYWQTVQTSVLRYAQRIICISNHTRADVNKWLDYPEEQVITIFPAIQDIFKPLDNVMTEPVKAQYGLCEKFILYVGGLAQHKNLRTLIKAFSLLKQSTSLPHKLVIVGGQYHTHNDMQAVTMAKYLLKDQVIFTGMVPEKDIPALYNSADLFVFPTLYEGFGLAPLEAMACGTPVIASQVGSLPEVLGQAALWVDTPLDEQAFATAIINVLQDTALQNQLSQKGLEQASKFSWSKTAAQTMEVYQSLTGKMPRPQEIKGD